MAGGSSRVIETDRGFKAWIKGVQKRSRGTPIGVKVGITADGDARGEGDSNVEIAAIHEFGAPKANIPERSFIRSTVDKNRKRYERALLKAEQAAIKNPRAGTAIVKSKLFVLGETAVADIQTTIDAQGFEPLADITVALKGDDFILVDTGEMRGAIHAKLIGF